MTDETTIDTPQTLPEISASSEGASSIADTKAQLAKMYLDFLDGQK